VCDVNRQGGANLRGNPMASKNMLTLDHRKWNRAEMIRISGMPQSSAVDRGNREGVTASREMKKGRDIAQRMKKMGKTSGGQKNTTLSGNKWNKRKRRMAM